MSAAFSFQRVGAMVLRYSYLLRSSHLRILDMVYWPAVQLLTWGFLQTYLLRAGALNAPGGGAQAAVAKAAQEFSRQADAVPEAPAPRLRTDWLRPPGSVDEAIFLDRCTKCGDCIKACDPGAIVCHAGDGTPVIFADQSPCLLCDDLPCIAACATDAALVRRTTKK